MTTLTCSRAAHTTAVILTTCLLSLALPAGAEQLTFNFAGTMDAADADFAAGEPFIGHYTFESTTAGVPNTSDCTINQEYRDLAGEWRVTFPNKSYEFTGTIVDIVVGNDTCIGDRYILTFLGATSVGTPLPSGRVLNFFQTSDLQDRYFDGADMLSDDSIQTTPPDFSIVGSIGSGRMSFFGGQPEAFLHTSQPTSAVSESINFSGQLDIIIEDNGSAIYSGVPVGTEFVGEFDLITGVSTISDGTIVTPFIADFENGGFLQVSNNKILDANDAGLINSVAGTSFVAGDIVDAIEIFGEVLTSGESIITIGVLYILDSNAFNYEGPIDSPPDPCHILTTLFFIFEENNLGEVIYDALGEVDTAGDGDGEKVLLGAAHSGPDGLSTLCGIDPLTGTGTRIGPIGFERCSAMDFDASGTLYATCERADESDTHVLITIDPSTGVGTEVGPTGVEFFNGIFGGNGTFSDISFQPSIGTLFAFSFPGEGLATVDLGTGTAAQVGFANFNSELGFQANDGNGLAFDLSGNLFHAAGEEPTGRTCSGEPPEGGGGAPGCPDLLHTVDPVTSLATIFTELSFPTPPPGAGPRPNAMDFDPVTGTLHASVVYGFGGAATNFLAQIDTTTGDVTIIGPTVSGLDALAFLPPDSDSDGVPDDIDNCPTVPNPGQVQTGSNVGGPYGDACVDPSVSLGEGVEIGENPMIGEDAKFGDNDPATDDNISIGDNADIGANTKIRANVDIGDNAIIGEGTKIEDGAMLADDVVVGSGVKIKAGAVIGDGVIIGDGAVINAGVTIAAGTIVPDGCKVKNDAPPLPSSCS